MQLTKEEIKFLELCREIGHGEIMQVTVRDGVPIKALVEKYTDIVKSIRFDLTNKKNYD